MDSIIKLVSIPLIKKELPLKHQGCHHCSVNNLFYFFLNEIGRNLAQDVILNLWNDFFFQVRILFFEPSVDVISAILWRENIKCTMYLQWKRDLDTLVLPILPALIQTDQQLPRFHQISL